MDIEFHYYMTYLIAARAGFKPIEATIIAHAAQGVDDNHIPVTLQDQSGNVYANHVSQTMDITRPHKDLYIYPIFHFIPGDPKFAGAKRIDGREHELNTTPNSALANSMIDAALNSNNLYRIGVSAHGFVDTWAHQNFVGKDDDFNEFPAGQFQRLLQKFFAVGHSFAKHNPDWPALVWEDSRLANSNVDNRARFLDAAEHLFLKLIKQVQPSIQDENLAREVASLRQDLDSDIGPRDDTNAMKEHRLARYVARSSTLPYGGQPIAIYDENIWFAEAINEPRESIIDEIKERLNAPIMEDVNAIIGDIYADGQPKQLTWKNPNESVYKLYPWYQFQQAVKEHLTECLAMLTKENIVLQSSV